MNLNQQVTSLKSQIYKSDKTIKRIEVLENMGFGIKELEQLSNIVMQIAVVNKIDKDVLYKNSSRISIVNMTANLDLRLQ